MLVSVSSQAAASTRQYTCFWNSAAVGLIPMSLSLVVPAGAWNCAWLPVGCIG